MRARRKRKPAWAPLTLAGAGILQACAPGNLGLGTPGLESRESLASGIARGGSLARMDIQSGPYRLASWRRLDDPAQPVNVYIEGDGLAWISRSSPSNNPTPTEPVALELAAADPAPNVVYIARPCQYTPLATSPGCSQDSWTSGRFDPGVIEAMNAAISQIPAAAGYTLTGFSGGANIAALIAARRSDILALRSVAGNLDPDALNTLHRVSPMPGALNARTVASALTRLPQIHFIGEQDKIVTPEIYQSYAAAAGPGACTTSRIVGGATHTQGWQSAWPELLRLPLPCARKP
jgi:hypothetical protein